MSNTTDTYWQGKQVLVTGAGGFIASHLTEKLVQLGADITALVKYNGANRWGNLETLAPEVKNSMRVVLGDITDPFQMQSLITPQTDCVFHLAALIGIPYSYIAPQHYVSVNINGTLNVLEACRKANGPRMVHTSTSEAYGTAQYAPIDEKHPLQGQSPYSATKIAADKLVESYWRSYELPVATLRPFNTYGPRQSARAFLPTIITQALSKPVIEVGDLTPKRDLLFVADTVNAFLAIARCDAALGEVIHVGTGATYSMQEVLDRLLTLLGQPDFPVKQKEERFRPPASEVFLLQCNPAKAKELMHWQAEYSLDDGLRLTLESIRSELAHYKTEQYTV